MSIPNLLSLLRLVLVPVFAVVFFQPAPDAHRWAVLIYLTAFLTDVADGWIARHFNQITKLGRILDPLADKLMTFTVIICITADRLDIYSQDLELYNTLNGTQNAQKVLQRSDGSAMLIDSTTARLYVPQ